MTRADHHRVRHLRRWLCRDHMAEEAVEVLDEIEELRRKADPTRQ